MNVVGHQHVGVNGYVMRQTAITQVLQVGGVILVIEKGGRAIDPAMGQVLRNAGQIKSGTAHGVRAK